MPTRSSRTSLLLLAGAIFALSVPACALPQASVARPAASGAPEEPAAVIPVEIPLEIPLKKTPAIVPPSAATPSAIPPSPMPRPSAVPVEVTPATAVFSPTAVFVPTATGALPTPSPSPASSPTATATFEPERGVRVVRQALSDGVYCPMAAALVRDDALLIGRSAVCDLPIVSYRLGEGDRALVLVGGIHGGYEWNTVLLAENALNYLRENPQAIPRELSVYVVPNANPDGLFRITGREAAFEPPETFEETIPGRFNGNDVDLNRNWDCEWRADGLWGNVPVSGGSAPFSEPETQALRDYFLQLEPAAVLFWHSAAEGVYASGCGETDPASTQIAQIYGAAAGYDVFDDFDNYDVTGEAGDWLAGQGIPAITVELTTHAALDWEVNLSGLEALMAYLGGGVM